MGGALREIFRTAAVVSWLLVGTAFAQTGTAASADDDVAHGLFEAGNAAYAAGNYEEALRFFEQAYERSQRPALLYNIGQAADRLRDDDKVLASFKAYLDQVPDAANRQEVEHRIGALKRARRARAASATPSPQSSRDPMPAAPTPAQVAAQGADTRPPSVPAVTEAHHETSQSASSDAVTTRWWFWTGVGAVVVAGTAVALAVALGGSNHVQASPYQGTGGTLRAP